MQAFFEKRTLTVFWLVLLLHCVFQYLQLPYVAVTKPMLTPLLFLHLLLHDNNIGYPKGKFIYYVGLILAFFGDVMLILINDTFFLSGMIAFMLMNLLYSFSFLQMNRLSKSSILPLTITVAFLVFIANAFYRFLGNEMGRYKVPVLVYMLTLAVMIAFAVNVAGNIRYKRAAINYLIPGVLVFLVENVLVAANKFHYDRDKDIFVIVMLTYGLAQYLIVKGMQKIYL
jgi:uncharacterized membrane protein YhhN